MSITLILSAIVGGILGTWATNYIIHRFGLGGGLLFLTTLVILLLLSI